MAQYEARHLTHDDFESIMRLEERIFAPDGEAVLGPYYVRLCCEFFHESCLIAMADGEPVGYLLSFLSNREVYCTTLAIVPEYHGSRVALLLLRGFLRAILGKVDSCWFTVKDDNETARALHRTLGAEEVGIRRNFYGPGDERIVSRISAERFAQMRSRYERLGLVDREAALAERRVS